MRLLTAERRDRARAAIKPLMARAGGLWAKAALSQRLDVRSWLIARRQGRGPSWAITPVPPTSLVITMASATVREYVESGQAARLDSALSRYARHFGQIVLVTPDDARFDDKFEAANVTHLRTPRLVIGPRALKAVAAVTFHLKEIRGASAVLALDEAGVAPGWLVARVSGSRMALSMGAPWSPPSSKNAFDGIRSWPLRLAARRVSDVTLWEGESESGIAEGAIAHRLSPFVDADLYCPLVTTDPHRPRMVGAFLPAADSASAMGLIGVAESLKRNGHSVMFRVFLLSGAAGEVQAAALQGEAAGRSAPIEFMAMPRAEMMPDVISRLRMCISFGYGEALPLTLRAMSSGVPCIVVGAGESETGPGRRDWRDFILRARGSNEGIVRCIEALLREPGLRLRMGREGRRYVLARHSLDAIAAEEAAVLKGAPADSPERADGFDADAEAEKLAELIEAVGMRQAADDLEVAV